MRQSYMGAGLTKRHIMDIWFYHRWVGAIHGKFLPFSTVRGIAGPAILLALRQREESNAIESLLSVVDPHLFAETFGAG